MLMPLRVALIWFAIGTCTALGGCPFCTLMPGAPTLHQLLVDYERIVLAKPLAHGDDEPRKGTRFEPLAVLKGAAVEGTITIDRSLKLSPSRTYILLSRSSDLADAKAKVVSRKARRFLEGAAALPARSPSNDAAVQRLRFFAGYLGHRDRLVSATVAREFAEVAFPAVQQAGAHFDLEELIDRIEGSGWSRAHQGLVYLLVALTKKETADRKLATWLADADRRDQVGFDGLIGAYLFVQGAAGIPTVMSHRPAADAPVARRRWFALALTRAMDFHGRTANRLPKDEVLTSLHALLDDVETTIPAIETMTRLEDWESAELVSEVLARWGADRKSIQRAARAYADARRRPRDTKPSEPRNG